MAGQDDDCEAQQTGHAKERRLSYLDKSETDNDTFEDAKESSSGQNRTSPALSTRDLISNQRQSSSTYHTIGVPQILPETQTEVIDREDHDIQETNQTKSPLLTSHRLSTSSLDNVNLEDVAPLSLHSGPPKDTSEKPPSVPKPSVANTIMGFSGALPSMPWSPPPSTTAPSKPANIAPIRKLTSPFSWLSRNTTTHKETVVSPPLPQTQSRRRQTNSSINTLSSNPEMMLSKLEENNESDTINATKDPIRNSLKDRFKLLRMRGEAGIPNLGDGDHPRMSDLAGRSSNTGSTSPRSTEGHSPVSPVSVSPHPPIVNNALAPGTAAGVSAGPSGMADASPVDWDLWQAVVYEGPAAVARTSPEELNKAIATGIPSAIRGVVWQVMAQSKNDELEGVYRELVARGTEKDKDRLSGSTGTSSVVSNSGSVNGNAKDKEVVVSSASSIHSDQSISTSHGIRSPSPSQDKDTESSIKAQAAAMTQKKKKAKEDAASLQKLEKTIKRDLGARTSFSKFAASAGLQDSLFGICKAYALFDEGVGYAQGMNFLAMPLLFNMPEEEAFCLLVKLMNQYHLRDLFIQDMPGLHMHLYQFERLLEDLEPALYCHLHRRQISPHLYATQWFLTLFTYRFPLQLVLRIYDLIFSEGLEAILKFGIVLMQKNAVVLLNMNDMVSLTSFLKDRLFDVYIDQSPSAGSILESGFFGSSGASIDKEVYRADMLVQDACAVKISPATLKVYNAEWEEKTKLEASRDAEVEGTKVINLALSQKVRRLEERIENHDSEHAALATELVRTKVENEELRDENESLRGQVQELRLVVEKQPEEVEQRLQHEMDRLLKRNQEVHEENNKLEDEMSEMEQTLVATKMKYAEMCAKHEALTRKWTDLRKALD